MALRLLKRFPRFLRTIPFWKDLIEEVDVELSYFKENQIDPLKNQFNPRALSTIKDLRDLNRYFGFNVDLSLLNEDYGVNENQIVIDYLKREAENMILKVRSKGTSEYHEYIFDRIGDPGFVYVMFYNSTDEGTFYKALNFYDAESPKIQEELLTHDFSTPFIKVNPLFPFRDGFLIQQSLDRDFVLDDPIEPWSFDYSLFGSNVDITKHVSAEWMAIRTYQVGSDTRLVTNELLEYLKKSMSFGRRAVEIPHAGINVSAYTKNNEAPWTVNDIDVTTSVTASWTADTRASLPLLYSEYTVGTLTQPIVESQIFSDDNFDVINLTFPGNYVYPETVATGNGTNDSFAFTLSYPAIDPGTIIIKYTDAGLTERTVKDDGYGNLYYPEFFSTEDFLNGNVPLNDYQAGTINYTTGACTLNTIDTSGTALDVTPGNLEELVARYYSFFSITLQSLSIKNNAGAEVVSISFPDIVILTKDYHISFLVIIDRRP